MNSIEGGKEVYTHQQFIFMTLDPVHIGAGGYRLGRVDNTIVREPGTNLPKIPGTSLTGAARSYSAMRYGKPEAAGQHKNFKGNKTKCPIIFTFGTASEADEGHAGTVKIGDARLLFFPVYSMAGPVWISTKDILTEAGFTINGGDVKAEQILTTLKWDKSNLNLGWLLLETKNGLKIDAPPKISNKPEWLTINERVVITSEKLFSQIVNSNLEVRTSVAINPETGAAEDKALFTYEAIPRAAWLICDVVENNYRKDFPATNKQFKIEENNGEPLGETWNTPMHVVKSGFKLIEYLGVGGMGTRGFGRMKIIVDYEEVQKK